MAIAEVIEFKGSPDLMVWKHPEENFNTTSQLIVDPTHEALFILNGNAADLFGEGRHTLSTSNIPIISKILNIPTGGKTPFPCKVYFINKVHQMDLLWGTKDPIPLEDPKYGLFFHVKIHGSLNYSIVDSRKFLLKLAGLYDKFTSQQLISKFRGIVVKYVKEEISRLMIKEKVSYFDVTADLASVSNVLNTRLNEVFFDYGIQIEAFNVESVNVSKEDYEIVNTAKALHASRQIQGYTWQEQRQMEIAQTFAGNEGSIGTIGGIVGGVTGGMVMGNAMTDVARNIFPQQGFNQQPVNSQQSAYDQQNSVKKLFCMECGNELSQTAKFCPECGTKVVRKEEKTHCPGCKQPITPDMKFCPDCGFSLR